MPKFLDSDSPSKNKDDAPLFVKHEREINLEALGFPEGITLFCDEIKGAAVKRDDDGALRVRVYMKNADAYITSIPFIGDGYKAEGIVRHINAWCGNTGSRA